MIYILKLNLYGYKINLYKFVLRTNASITQSYSLIEKRFHCLCLTFNIIIIALHGTLLLETPKILFCTLIWGGRGNKKYIIYKLAKNVDTTLLMAPKYIFVYNKLNIYCFRLRICNKEKQPRKLLLQKPEARF